MDATAEKFLKMTYTSNDQKAFNASLNAFLIAEGVKKVDLPVRLAKELKDNPDSLPKTSQEALRFLTYLPLSRFRTGDSWNAMLKILSPEDKKKLPPVKTVWGEQKLLHAILAFEDRPFPNGPEPDGGFNRIDQLVDVGMPEAPPVEIREALMVRPYYLGHEERWMPDACKFPATHKLLKALPFRGDPKPPEALPKEVVKEEEMKPEYPAVEEMTKTKTEYPAVESVLAAEEADAGQSLKIPLKLDNQGDDLSALVKLIKQKRLKVEVEKPKVVWEITVSNAEDDSETYEVVEDEGNISIESRKTEHEKNVSRGQKFLLNDLLDIVAADFWKGSEADKKKKENIPF
jgi:hypothetical protein